MITKIAVALAFMAACGAANATYSLRPAEIYPLDNAVPESVAIGDINGDGRQDVVLVTTYAYHGSDYDESVLVLLQEIDGSLGAPHKVPYVGPGFVPWPTGTTGLALADLDGDGRPEIVVSGEGGISVIDWLPDGSNGQFVSRNFYDHTEKQFGYGDIAILQANFDPSWEVIAQSWNEGATIFLDQGVNRSRKQLAMPTQLAGYNDIQAGDVDGDGKTDLVMVTNRSTKAYVYYNDGSGDLAEPVELELGVYPSAIVLADYFGQDNVDELVVSTWDTLNVYQFDARDGAHLAAQLETSSNVLAMQAADLDGDGWRDLAAASSGGRISTYLSEDGLALLPEVSYSSGNGSWPNSDGFAVGDVDGDGCNDVALADSNYGLVVNKGTGCAVGPAPLPDLAARIHPAQGYFDFHLANVGMADAPSSSASLTLDLSWGGLTVGALPPECSKTSHTNQKAYLTCNYPGLPVGDAATSRIPFTVSDFGKKAMLTIVASVPGVTGGEERTDNNSARVRVRLMPATRTPAPGARRKTAPVDGAGMRAR